MSILLISITTAYIILIGSFVIGYFKLKIIKPEESLIKNSFSIIIPFRNEAQNLPILLDSISTLNYSKEHFEVLLINDDSQDNYESIINTFIKNNPTIQLQVIQNVRKSKSPKKDAINTGIVSSKFEWILTTDADCELPTKWIDSYNSYIEVHHPNFIAGPVTFKESTHWFGKFQSIDFAALIGCTMGAFGINRPFMCNGANLCYNKETFNLLNGFEGNENTASGDDVFLLEKMIQYDSNKVLFLKSYDALIHTNPQSTIKNLVNQRVRWASKTTAYTNVFSKLVAVIVLLMNFIFTTLILKSIIYLEINILFIAILISKITIGLCIILPTINFMKTKFNFSQFAVIIWLQPIFLIYISVLSIFKKKYQWKNRDLK